MLPGRRRRCGAWSWQRRRASTSRSSRFPAGQDPADAPGRVRRPAAKRGELSRLPRAPRDRALGRSAGRVRAGARGASERSEDSPERQEALRLLADRLDLPRETLARSRARARGSRTRAGGCTAAPRCRRPPRARRPRRLRCASVARAWVDRVVVRPLRRGAQPPLPRHARHRQGRPGAHGAACGTRRTCGPGSARRANGDGAPAPAPGAEAEARSRWARTSPGRPSCRRTSPRSARPWRS